MAFVRRRNTSSGRLSTALVESYRDDNGKPRQRVLANLYGMASPLEALAKLAAQREKLRKEKAAIQPDLKGAENFYNWFSAESVARGNFSVEERKEIDKLLPARKRLVKRAEKIDGDLARIEKNGAVIKKHCDASPKEIQTAIRVYKKEMDKAEAMAVGMGFIREQAKRKSRL